MVYCVTHAYLFYGIKLEGWNEEYEEIDEETYEDQFEKKIKQFTKENPKLAKIISFPRIIMGDEESQYYLVIKDSISESLDMEPVVVSTYEMFSLTASGFNQASLLQAMEALGINWVAPRWILVSEGYSST